MRKCLIPGSACLTLVAASYVSAASVETATRPFLWKLETPKATAYLFGSLHAGRSDLYPLDPRCTARSTPATAWWWKPIPWRRTRMPSPAPC